MKLSVQDLKRVLNRLFEHLQDKGVTEVELSRELYWVVPSNCLYDIDIPPGQIQLNVGDLSDDWNFVKELLKEDDEPVGFQLTEAAPLVAALGHWAAAELGKKGG